jgi:hypothetical protein
VDANKKGKGVLILNLNRISCFTAFLAAILALAAPALPSPRLLIWNEGGG